MGEKTNLICKYRKEQIYQEGKICSFHPDEVSQKPQDSNDISG